MLRMGLFRSMTLGLLVLGSVTFAKTVETVAKHVQNEKTINGGSNLTTGNLGRQTTLKPTTPCYANTSDFTIFQRHGYTVLRNFVPMSKKFSCLESVTFVTHSDFTYLDNLESLVLRWRAPISIALFAPGDDFFLTISSIQYLRTCRNPLISELVSFHLYFTTYREYQTIPQAREMILSQRYNCRHFLPPWERILRPDTWKNNYFTSESLTFGLNIAKEMAPTHYILVADIEIYPSLNLVPQFLDMLGRNDQPELSTTNRKVFLLPRFEVEKNSTLPSNKTELIDMLKDRRAFPFHSEICLEGEEFLCQDSVRNATASNFFIPDFPLWKNELPSNTLRVFHTMKRTGVYAALDPVYIGTAEDPMYDHRIIMNGYDKRIQGWILCALNYDFIILDNAFVVHRSGIEFYNARAEPREDRIEKMNDVIRQEILPEYKKTYGNHSECAV